MRLPEGQHSDIMTALRPGTPSAREKANFFAGFDAQNPPFLPPFPAKRPSKSPFFANSRTSFVGHCIHIQPSVASTQLSAIRGSHSQFRFGIDPGLVIEGRLHGHDSADYGYPARTRLQTAVNPIADPCRHGQREVLPNAAAYLRYMAF
jgi:hypothetical protein